MVNFGELNLKTFIIAFVGIIIAVVIIASVGDSIFTQTNTLTVSNTTITPSTTGNGTVDLLGREFLVGTGIVTNATNGTILGAGNFTLQTQLSSTTGLLTVVLVTNDSRFPDITQATGAVNVSYGYNPEGFVSDTAARAITRLILIFAALAIIIFAIIMLLAPIIKSAGKR